VEINVLGYGLMAKQIAALFYLGGFDVILWNYSPVNEVELYKSIKLLNRYMSSDRVGKLSFITDLERMKDNFTIESVVEELNTKIQIYEKLEHVVSKGYFTNTSSYAPSEIGKNVGGFHFYNPITIKIIELCVPLIDVSDEMSEVMSYLKSVGYDLITVNSNRGYVGNYILFHEISSVLKLIEKNNYKVDVVNAVYAKLYEGRNIFNIIDIIGIDVVLKILQNLKEEDNGIFIPASLNYAIENNIFGKKNKTSISMALNQLNRKL
jgi:3-hydroxyacyl-CoA dehydrogenase